jgi:ABC-type glycerol-3-phosphate transport system substrate-binding protein
MAMRSRLTGAPGLAKVFFILIMVTPLALLVFNWQTLVGEGCVPQTTTTTVSNPPETITPYYIGTGEYLRQRQTAAIEIAATSYNYPIAADDISAQYNGDSILLEQGTSLTFTVTIPTDGFYTLIFDMAASANSAMPEGQLTIDGQEAVGALQRFTFPIFYRNSSEIFPKDRYGNDALIQQVRDIRWSGVPIQDANFNQSYPQQIALQAGEHHFQFTLNIGQMYLGSIYLVPFTPYPDYETYLAAHPSEDRSGFWLALEAEAPTYKNETSVRPNTNRHLTVTPYDTYCMLLNIMGGESWKTSGSTVYYEISVPDDGYYALSMRALQDTRSNFTVFRRITINGMVPFKEFNAIPFPYSANWVDVNLPYKVFLRAGTNTIGIEATSAPYQPAIDTIQSALLDINTLALEIRRLTGNQRDPFKEWVISDYIPDIEDRLNTISQRLIDDKNTLLSEDGESISPETLTYQMAIDNLLFLSADPDQIPVYMSRFSEGSGSAAQLLGSLLPLLQSQPLALDRIIIHDPGILPETPAVSMTTALTEDLRRFIHSFRPDPYQTIGAQSDELEVWVNRSRQYVNLLQWMADSTFTPQTGIRVKFSIMPDESKLILANAAGIQPDVALGVSTDRPYELAIRNALYDLRSFEDFDDFIQVYAPGALLSYVINDSVYALPETQDFWVTFYRRDILDSLGIPVPDTWDEVLEILPELQRYGMNYNTPLSSGAGFKNYLMTAPFLFNFGAPLYSDDGFATGLQDEQAIASIRFMADLFTIYGMPLTTADFYQGFRYGTVPIGISNLTTYVKLATAAPEIGGLWGIDLYPATVLADGTQNRYATGSAQSSIMFQNTDMPTEGWEFLKWWMSTGTQTEFSREIVLNYGVEYLWFSANLEAFDVMQIPVEHRNVIRAQWQWLQEPVRLPGSYLQERELSNIWNRIVFDGINPRVAIDRSVILINREITRKMEEFGYLQDGEQVREFHIPTIDTVIGWMEDAD